MTREGTNAPAVGLDCPACGGVGGAAGVIPRNQLALCRCRACGLIYQQEPPSMAELRVLYTPEYYTHWAGDSDRAAVWAMKVKTADAYLVLLQRTLRRRPADIRLLDVGCAQGALLEAARSRGIEAAGIEISGVASAPRDRGFVVYDEPIESLDLPQGSFDMVTAIDVVEHVPRLDAFVGAMKRLLKPGGVMLLVTPDVTSASARLLGGYWPHYKREHLVYFGPRSLSVLLRGAGLDVVHVRPAFKYLTFGYITRHFARYSPGSVATALALVGRAIPGVLVNVPVRVRSGMLAVARRPAGPRP